MSSYDDKVIDFEIAVSCPGPAAIGHGRLEDAGWNTDDMIARTSG